jgi:hypothetical protein
MQRQSLYADEPVGRDVFHDISDVVRTGKFYDEPGDVVLLSTQAPWPATAVQSSLATTNANSLAARSMTTNS